MREIPSWPPGAEHGPDEQALEGWIEEAGPYLRLTPHRSAERTEEETLEITPPLRPEHGGTNDP